MVSLLEGFLLQAGLIWGLGAQNIFVVESGIKKQHHFLVAGLCSVFDTVLIFVGVLFASYVLRENPYLQAAMGGIAWLFLVAYGGAKIRQGMQKTPVHTTDRNCAVDWQKAVLLTCGFSLLNPHVYLDTILFVGSYSTKFSQWDHRIYFAAGASLFSVLWFFGLSTLGSRMSRYFESAIAMQRASLVSGVLLLLLACGLSVQVWQWFVVII